MTWWNKLFGVKKTIEPPVAHPKPRPRIYESVEQLKAARPGPRLMKKAG